MKEEKKKVVIEGWLSKHSNLAAPAMWIRGRKNLPRVLEITECIYQENTEALVDYYDGEF